MKKERLLYIFLVSAVLAGLWGTMIPPDAEYRKELVRDEFWLHKVFGTERYDIVITGDSRVYRGISPKEMSGKLPEHSIFNFGFSSGILDDTLLSRTLEKLDPSGDRTLVLAITPHALTEKSNEQLKELDRTSLEERYLVFNHPFFFHFFHRIQKGMLEDLANIFSLGRINHREENYVESYDIATGWVASSLRNETGVEKKTLHRYNEMRIKYPISPDRTKRLEQQIGTIIASGVRVFFLYIPASPSMLELERNWPGFNYPQIRHSLESIGAISLDDVIPQGLHSYDGSHLDEQSARSLSQSLSETIRAHL